MPVVTVGGAGPGWGCSCRAFRFGEPSPEAAFKAFARSASVKFAVVREHDEGIVDFQAWTNKEAVYDVTFDPAMAGGFCKHCAACAAHIAGGWLKIAAVGTQQEQEKMSRERKGQRSKG